MTSCVWSDVCSAASCPSTSLTQSAWRGWSTSTILSVTTMQSGRHACFFFCAYVHDTWHACAWHVLCHFVYTIDFFIEHLMHYLLQDTGKCLLGLIPLCMYVWLWRMRGYLRDLIQAQQDSELEEEQKKKSIVAHVIQLVSKCSTAPKSKIHFDNQRPSLMIIWCGLFRTVAWLDEVPGLFGLSCKITGWQWTERESPQVHRH